MFVSRRTHKSVLDEMKKIRQELYELESSLYHADYVITTYKRRNAVLTDEVYNLRRKIQTDNTFTKRELQILLSLCHPDKHDGKDIAGEMTKKLLDLKKNMSS